MTHYANGARYERYAKATLERLGYFVVRAAGSHGPVDLVAIPRRSLKSVVPLLIQVKSGKRRPSAKAVDELAAMDAVGLREVWYYAPWQPVEIIYVRGTVPADVAP